MTMAYLVLGKDPFQRGWEKSYQTAVANPEEAVKEAGFGGYPTLRVYPIQVRDDGAVMEWDKEDLDL